MSERRSLVEGLKAATSKVDPNVEKAFVFGADNSVTEVKESSIRNVARSPLSTRVRADLAAALKRASLERQLSNTHPNSLQDILEEALEAWLKANGLTSSID